MDKDVTNEIFRTGYIYTPKEKISNLSEIYDADKYYKLINKIEKSNVDKDVKEFLKLTATRFIRYNFKKIADYYCALPLETQKLFEENKLVIIDDNHTIENAVNKLHNRITELRIENERGQEIHS